MKTAISLPDALFKAGDSLAERLGATVNWNVSPPLYTASATPSTDVMNHQIPTDRMAPGIT